jgi:hypothetical protein
MEEIWYPYLVGTIWDDKYWDFRHKALPGRNAAVDKFKLYLAKQYEFINNNPRFSKEPNSFMTRSLLKADLRNQKLSFLENEVIN